MQQKLKELYAYCSDITQQETIQTKQSLENEICEKEAILHDILTQIQSHPYVRALALSFQESATTHLVQKCKKYLQNTNHIKHFAIVGGASANSLLREKLRNLCQKFDKTLLMSDIAFCADNAAMIGRATLAKIHSNPDIIKQRDSVMQNITSKGYLQIKDTDLLDQHIKNIKQIAQDKQNYIYSPQKSLLENVQNLCKQKQLDDTKANGEVSKKSCITPDESEKYKEKTYSEQEKDMKDRDSPFFDYLLQQLLELDISPRNTEI
nr:hypothetical protein [Helicobacter didelphidarum]